jgi:cell division protein FtsW
VTATRRDRPTTRRSSPTRATSPGRSRPSVGALPGWGTVVVAVVALLCAIGVVMVFSASSVTSVRDTGTSWSFALRQLAWLAGGCGLAWLASRVPAEVWRERLGPVLMGLSVAGLAWLAASVVLDRLVGQGLPFAIEVKGATRWVGVGPLQFQPSELAKPAMVLWVARLLGERRDLGTWVGLRPVLIALGGTCLLVVIGDDLGTTLLLGVIVLTLLLMAGAPWRILGMLTGALVMVAVVVLTTLEGFRLARIAAFLDPVAHGADKAWQVRQSQIGLASGGLFGSGPGYSRAKWGFLPEAHTDFILSVIGEEFGLVGTVVVIGLFLALILAGCSIAMGTTDRFRRLVAIGVTAWLGTQALINVGVAVGTLPTKGITLPFVSYGGSSLMTSLLGVGILLAMARGPAPRVVDLSDRRRPRATARRP